MGDARIIPFDGTAARRTNRSAAAPDGEVPVRRTAGKTGKTAKHDGNKVRKLHSADPLAAVAEEIDALAEPAPAVPRPSLKGTAGLLGRALEGAAKVAGTVTGKAAGAVVDTVAGPNWEEKAAGGLAFLRRRITGDYEVDEFGFDQELTDDVVMRLLRPVYEKYFRVEVTGMENIPAEGGALIVANHSGTLPLDALMTQVAVRDHHPGGRSLRLLGADLVFQLPVVGQLARKSGHTLACNADANRLLSQGELVGVWPEGFKGLGKPFSERYKLQRFGRGGFVSAALQNQVPIIPCSIVGAEEVYPMIGNLRPLARLLGLPYFPVTPTFPLAGPLGMVPLPTKWRIQFGEPIRTDSYPAEASDDPMVVFNLTDEVRETIQHTIYRLLMQRRSVFF